jgi:hypothetical protein
MRALEGTAASGCAPINATQPANLVEHVFRQFNESCLLARKQNGASD